MSLKSSLWKPITNESGFAVMIMVTMISVTVISYSLYASNYFLLLNGEVKNSKKVINGMNVLSQVAQTLITPRIEYQITMAGTADCLDRPEFNQMYHELCIKDALIVKDNGVCIPNPFIDPPLLCITNASPGAAYNIIDVTGYKEPTWYDPFVKPIQKFNFQYGKSMVAMAESLSNRALAYPDQNELPALVGAPVLTKDPVMNAACDAGSNPSEECMRCRDDPAGAADNIRPQCYTIRLCLRPDLNADGYGNCDPGINEQWIWQMVAVFPEVGP